MKEEPPFDDSLACPCCQLGVRAVFADMANLCTSWPAKGSAKNVSYLRARNAFVVEVPDPTVQAMLDLAEPIRLAKTYAEIALLMPAIRKAVADVEPLMDQHFDNRAHAQRA
jgi:hypothetical protein